MSSGMRWGARLFYAKLPESTNDEAMRHFEKAEALNPNFYSANLYYLGITADHLNRKNEAVSYLKRAFAYPVISQDDKDIHKKAGEYLMANYRHVFEELINEIESSNKP